MSKCPACGKDDAYLGFNVDILCVNHKCQYFNSAWVKEIYELKPANEVFCERCQQNLAVCSCKSDIIHMPGLYSGQYGYP